MIKEIEDVVELVKDHTKLDVAICSLVGSRNYNLQGEGSDFDFITFVIPPKGRSYKGKKLGDIPINDLNGLPDRLWGSYPLDLEIVFSEERYMVGEMDSLLYDNREKIARMNLPKFYEKHIRKYNEYCKGMVKGTVNTQHLVAEYGYDTKQAMHAFRMLCVLQVFADTGNFERALRYKGTEREFLMEIRNGKYALEDAQKLLVQKFELVEEKYKDKYATSETYPDMYETLKEGIDLFISKR